eukprot:CAMPEP_0204630540 /NCGR_PEP_ID=MMETSP0717-20131115/20730_1 /ASSEMBLY_ACC=CAM_ASM_000666 /TAXON_ID=230516 /ORGANISM="Chaetoceros curvisetus" /LENGTH=56 /DNA_ID=CAMNT_0051647823 /DNA_START=68 /DNA_END=238 /DNA_ORIENTATION=+
MTDEFLSQGFITHPASGIDNQPLDWWSKDVEEFLSTSMDGLGRVEKEATTLYKERA